MLIDSRMGITDIGGICTIQLPDLLLLLFTATEQGISGIADVGRKASEARHSLPFDRSKLLTLPVASRLDIDKEFELSREWLRRSSEELADLYADWLPRSFEIYHILEVTKIPYIGYFSFGEKLAVMEETLSSPTSLGYAYVTLAALIADTLK